MHLLSLSLHHLEASFTLSFIEIYNLGEQSFKNKFYQKYINILKT